MMRPHWMCTICQRNVLHVPDADLTPWSARGICCWCGNRTARFAPLGLELPCQDVHIEDVTADA